MNECLTKLKSDIENDRSWTKLAENMFNKIVSRDGIVLKYIAECCKL